MPIFPSKDGIGPRNLLRRHKVTRTYLQYYEHTFVCRCTYMLRMWLGTYLVYATTSNLLGTVLAVHAGVWIGLHLPALLSVGRYWQLPRWSIPKIIMIVGIVDDTYLLCTYFCAITLYPASIPSERPVRLCPCSLFKFPFCAVHPHSQR